MSMHLLHILSILRQFLCSSFKSLTGIGGGNCFILKPFKIEEESLASANHYSPQVYDRQLKNCLKMERMCNKCIDMSCTFT